MRSAINSENDTSGAHDGAVTAIVSASLTPMMTPATNGPSGRPMPPIITTANTTPTRDQLIERARALIPDL